MIPSLAETWRFFQDNSWRTIMARMNARDTHPLIQFIKYGICGVGSVIVGQGLFFILATWVWPAFGSEIPQDVRALHSLYSNSVAFFFGNLFAYYTNSKWVFTPGRHHRALEFLFFTAISTVAFFVGLLTGPLLIKIYGIATIWSQLMMIVCSALVNFACRKFFVFKH